MNGFLRFLKIFYILVILILKIKDNLSVSCNADERDLYLLFVFIEYCISSDIKKYATFLDLNLLLIKFILPLKLLVRVT